MTTRDTPRPLITATGRRGALLTYAWFGIVPSAIAWALYCLVPRATSKALSFGTCLGLGLCITFLWPWLAMNFMTHGMPRRQAYLRAAAATGLGVLVSGGLSWLVAH